jgi:hypothetical protein
VDRWALLEAINDAYNDASGSNDMVLDLLQLRDCIDRAHMG